MRGRASKLLCSRKGLERRSHTPSPFIGLGVGEACPVALMSVSELVTIRTSPFVRAKQEALRGFLRNGDMMFGLVYSCHEAHSIL